VARDTFETRREPTGDSLRTVLRESRAAAKGAQAASGTSRRDTPEMAA
jgi:hypothetical protein